MEYCIDYIYRKENKIYATGWVVASAQKNTIEIEAMDWGGRKLAVEAARAARPDISLAKLESTEVADNGFFVKIPCPRGRRVKLVFRELDDKGEVVACSTEGLDLLRLLKRTAVSRARHDMICTKRVLVKAKKKLLHKEDIDYDKWMRVMRASDLELRQQRQTHLSYEPKFSVIVPLYHTRADFLRDMVRSVIRQSYGNWELLLVNASPQDARLCRDVQAWAVLDKRIRVITLEKNLGIAENTNAGIREASGDFIALLDHDDFLAEEALFCYAQLLNQDSSINVLYSDEDKADEHGTYFFYPHFKPDYNPELLHANNYICHFLAVRKSLADFVGGLDSRYDGSQDYDFVLKLTEHTNRIRHCPKILYHWRCSSQSTAASQGNKPYIVQAGIDALNAHYQRLGLEARAEAGAIDGWYKTRYELKDQPLVSVLIPNKDHIEDLAVCLQSLYDRASYSNFEIVIIENNSEDPETFAYYKKLEKEHGNLRVVFWDSVFNYSAINNYGASFARGEYLLLLNNDVELISPDMFEKMLGYCMRPQIGIVGAKLLYNDHTVQHAGVLVGVGGMANHAFRGLHEDAPGYMGRAISVQNVSAVTAACLMVKKCVYDELGGLDEAFQVAYNDVDFCLRAGRAGYQVVYDADVKLFHYESKSRGVEDTMERFIRFGNETALLNSRWNILTTYTDPHYNPNLSKVEAFEVDYSRMEERRTELKKQGVYVYGE